MWIAGSKYIAVISEVTFGDLNTPDWSHVIKTNDLPTKTSTLDDIHQVATHSFPSGFIISIVLLLIYC